VPSHRLPELKPRIPDASFDLTAVDDKVLVHPASTIFYRSTYTKIYLVSQGPPRAGPSSCSVPLQCRYTMTVEYGHCTAHGSPVPTTPAALSATAWRHRPPLSRLSARSEPIVDMRQLPHDRPSCLRFINATSLVVF